MLPLDLVWPHHLIVRMIDDMALPDIARTLGRIEGVKVTSRSREKIRYACRRPARQEPRHLAWEGFCSVFPSGFLRGWRGGIAQEIRLDAGVAADDRNGPAIYYRCFSVVIWQWRTVARAGVLGIGRGRTLWWQIIWISEGSSPCIKVS